MKHKISNILVGQWNVQVIRKANKNIYIRVNEQNQIVVTAPFRLSDAVIQSVVEKERTVVERMLEKVALKKEQAPKLDSEWALNASTFLLWGEKKRLRIMEDSARSRHFQYYLAADAIEIQIPTGRKTQDTLELIFKLIYIEQMQHYLQRAAYPWSERMNVPLRGYKVREMKSRWGSCTPKTGQIRINSYLAQYPECCVEMVLVHELVHFYEPYHNQHFYQLMDKHLPTWKESETILKEWVPYGLPMR